MKGCDYLAVEEIRLGGGPTALASERKIFSVNPNLRISLSAGVNELPAPSLYNEIFIRELQQFDIMHSYVPPMGNSLVRSAIRHYERKLAGVSDDSEEYAQTVCVTAGATAAITFYFEFLAFKGKKRGLFLGLQYILFKMAALRYRLQYDVLVSSVQGRIAPTLDEIREKAKEKWDFFVLTLPLNPSGEMYTEEEFRQILRICKEKNILLLIDKCQWDIILQDQTAISYSIGKIIIEEDSCQLVTIINSLSKTRSIPGARLGYVFGNAELMDYLEYLNTITYWQASSLYSFSLIIDLLIQLDYLASSEKASKKIHMDYRHMLLLTTQNREWITFLFSLMDGDSYIHIKTQLVKTLQQNNHIVEVNHALVQRYAKIYELPLTPLQGGFNFCVMAHGKPNHLEKNIKEHLLLEKGMEILTQTDFCGKESRVGEPFWYRITCAQNPLDFQNYIGLIAHDLFDI